MSNPLDQHPIYSLLPAVFRNRDLAKGGPLQALFDVLGSQASLVDDNIDQLYDDQFIETCAPWVIPYLADLIGFSPLYTVGLDGLDSRAEVADTIGYRRRKGTLLALQQVATDVAGRPVIAIEEFRRVTTTLSLRDVRPHHLTTIDIRSPRALSRFSGPFEKPSHTVDVRRIAPRLRTPVNPDPAPLEIDIHGGGCSNVPNVALWIWRWRSFPMDGVPATPLGKGRFLFSPLGAEMPLFQRPPARIPFDRLSTSLDVPQPITTANFRKHPERFYPDSFQLIADGTPVPLDRIWPTSLVCTPDPPIPLGMIGVDPQTGRIEFAPTAPLPASLTLDFAYGFPGEIGGGAYDRSSRLPASTPAMSVWTAQVGSAEYPTLASAMAEWNARPTGSAGRILIPSFTAAREDLTGLNAILLSPESSLLIAAAELVPNPPNPPVPVWSNAFPTLTGDFEISAAIASPMPDGGAAPLAQLKISGLRIAGQIRITGAAFSLQIEDTTLVPGLALTICADPVAPGEPSITGEAPGTCVCINRAITGPIALDPTSSLRITSSIVDAGSSCCPALAAPDLVSAGATLHVEDSTIIGKVHVQAIRLASNTIFHAHTHRHDGWKAAVWSTRRQIGCVRFCSLPWLSLVPQRYRCLPDNSADEGLFAPQFITLRYGQPGYCLLSGDVPLALWKGADNGSQIGVWLELAETEAVRNVQIRAPEFMPANLESGIFLIPSRPARQHHRELAYGRIAARGGCNEDDEQMPSGIGIELL